MIRKITASNACACGKPVADAFICSECTNTLADDLATVPWLANQLDLAIAKRTRYVDHIGVRSPFSEPLPYAPEASESASVLRSTLTAWVHLAAEQATSGDASQRDGLWHLSGMASYLHRNLALIRARSDAADAVDEIGAAIRQASQIVDRPVERWYAGPCDECDHDLYAKPGVTQLACNCGAKYDIRERRTWLLTEAENVLATAADISRALTTLDAPVNADRIYQWRRRKRLLDHGRDHDGNPLYRVGDILELLANVRDRQRRAPYLR